MESTPGVVVDHCTSKFQLELAGSSASTSPASVSQHSVRLSLPHVSSSPGSALDHAIASTPLECPTNSRAGEMELRRSQICRDGERSSSDATMSCVATSGFHCSAEHRRRELGSVNEITGRCRFRSHTTVVPFRDEDARMCCTLLFHARKDTSPVSGWPAPPFSGGYSEGVVGFARSQMHSSPSSAPDASRFGLNALNSRPRTGPVCFCIFVNSAPPAPSAGSAPTGEPMIRPGL